MPFTNGGWLEQESSRWYDLSAEQRAWENQMAQMRNAERMIEVGARRGWLQLGTLVTVGAALFETQGFFNSTRVPRWLAAAILGLASLAGVLALLVAARLIYLALQRGTVKTSIAGLEHHRTMKGWGDEVRSYPLV